MALSYSIEGKGVIANADSTSADTALTPNGTWSANGSGGASISLTTDTFYYGNSSIAAAVSGANKFNWITFDTGTGNTLDFGASGTEENQLIYIWVHCPTIGLSKTLANEGVSIRAGSSTSDYRIFVIAGSDESNGWDGKWKCFVIDPTKTGSITDVGTPNLSSIRYIGARLETTATAKGDNLFVSQIAVGSGIRITGTSTTAWLDAVTYCTDLANRAWGMLQEREGIYYAYGNIIIGNTAMTANTDFDDEGRVVQFGLSEYWSGTGTTFNTALPTTACGITLEDDNTPTTYTTTFTDGVIVGTDNGRSGTTFIGNANEEVFFDASGLANTSSDMNLYGTTFNSFTGGITFEADTNHAVLGCSFIKCAQVDPVGGVVIRNCTFAEVAPVTGANSAALLWNSNIDIEACQFIANSDPDVTYVGHGIEFDTAITDDLIGLTFSGNEKGVWFSATTGNLILSNDADSDLGASDYTNDSSGTVTIQSSVTVTINVEDKADGSDIQYANVYINKPASVQAYTADTGNTAGDGDLVVNEVVDTAIPQSGWVFIWVKSLNKLQGYRFTSWTTKTFTFPTTVSFNCTGGGSSTLLQDTVNSFISLNIEVGDTVRNTTDGSWAVVDEITDADNIVTSPLSGGSDNTWTSGDTYSFHDLATTLTDNDDLVDIPLSFKQTNVSGQVTQALTSSGFNVLIRVRYTEGVTKYDYEDTTQFLGAGGLTATIQLEEQTGIV